MPSLEIICLEQETPSQFSDLPFALRSENTLIPHRGLFWEDFKLHRGCIYHLGNPDMRFTDDYGFFAGQLMDWNTENLSLKFLPEFVPPLQTLLQTLIAASPVGKLIFTTDYQFGGSTMRYKRPLPLEKFWEKHDTEKLWLNALYPLVL